MRSSDFVSLVVETPVSSTLRARAVSSMFDAPPEETCRLEWKLEFPYDAEPWNVGLIVGPSGSGKSTIMKHVFGGERPLTWGAAGVVDDFSAKASVEDIAAVCQAVGFNTIPAWLRPFAVLSNGEKFRVELARRLLEDGDPIVVDEFSSVVDRQVAKIASHAVQKYVRKTKRRFVAVTCHFDVTEWLQPDWVLDVSTRTFTRRLLQRRPELRLTIGRIPRAAWSLFAPYHYMSAELHTAAKCYGLWCEGRLAAFAALLPVPVSSGRHRGEAITRISRLVTLPDFQGLGLAMVLCDALGAEHRAVGRRFRMYPAHPALVRVFDRSRVWALKKKPGVFSTTNSGGNAAPGQMGGRPCAVFEYVGPKATEARLLAGEQALRGRG